ncbi:MAG: hypothetical protein GY832_13665 [Chloroflexi bacterium]|nr:hypothetical protein [Chloroflexota bacterium]
MFNRVVILKRIEGIIIFTVVCILLFAALKGYFQSDDFFHLRTHKFSVLEDPATIFTESEVSGHYRPMVKIFWWATYFFFELRPFGYFVVLIVAFLATIYLFFLLAKTLTVNTLGAHIAVLLFLLQLNTYLYTLNWIGAVNNVLSSFFIIATLLIHVKSTSSTRHIRLYNFLAYITFGLSLLSREISVVVLLPTLLVYDFMFLWLETTDKKKVLRERIWRYILYVILIVVYVLIRSAASGTISISGAGNYEFIPSFHIINSILFFGTQLGFLPTAVVLLSVAVFLFNKVEFTKREIKLIIFGILFTSTAVLPFLFLDWTSPTWLYLPVFGITFATSVLFHGIYERSSKARLILYRTIVWAIIGSGFLFLKLDEARWWQWGVYTRNVIEQVQAYYPDLPQDAVLYFIDKDEGKPYGLEGLFRSRKNLRGVWQIWYNIPSWNATTLAMLRQMQLKPASRRNSRMATEKFSSLSIVKDTFSTKQTFFVKIKPIISFCL